MDDMDLEEAPNLVENLFKATEVGDYVTVAKLLQSGWVSVHSTDQYQRTALHIAVASGCAPLVKYLIEIKADVAAKDIKGNSPLHIATISHKPQIVTLLLQAGVNPEQTDAFGKTPIGWIQDRMRGLRGAMYQRRLQFADENEIMEIKNHILEELRKMIEEITQWSSQSPLINQLQVAASTIGNEHFSLDELDNLFTSLSI